MTSRQLLIFKIGCIAAFAAAAMHMVGQLMGPTPPQNDTERQLVELATTYRFPLPGGAERSLMDFINGFGLMFAITCALIGGVGWVVQKRAGGDALLAIAVVRVLAGACAAMLVISLTHFFIVPTLFIGLMTVCFAIASVRSPG